MEDKNKIMIERSERDRELVRKVLEGDQGAFTKLVREYYRAFYGIALTYSKDPDLSEDVIQEALIEIYSNLPYLQNPERFSSWAYTIVRRKSILMIKSMKKIEIPMSKLSYQDQLMVEQSTNLSYKGTSLESSIRQNTIIKKIYELPHKYREASMMYFVGEMDFDEIAEVLHISRHNAQMRVFRAKEKIQENLKGLL